MGDPTYSDETRAGRDSKEFREIPRSTIAARISDPGGFEWLRRFWKDHLGDSLELKSDIVLEVVRAKPAARRDLFAHIGTATIVVIDLSEHYRSLFSEIARATGKKAFNNREVLELLKDMTRVREIGKDLLRAARKTAFYSSAIPNIEILLRDVIHASDAPAGHSGALFDQVALDGLNEQQFHELLARFAVAFADALDPTRQGELVRQNLENSRFIVPGYIGFVTLGDEAREDRIFDFGDPTAFGLLRRAHYRIVSELTAVQDRFLWSKLRGGKIVQEDSAQLLGIQAADIAAGVASSEYENYPSDRMAGAAAIRQLFDRVLINNKWL